MEKLKRIIIVRGEKYYHDSNVAGLMCLSFFVGMTTGPFIGAMYLLLFK